MSLELLKDYIILKSLDGKSAEEIAKIHPGLIKRGYIKRKKESSDGGWYVPEQYSFTSKTRDVTKSRLLRLAEVFVNKCEKKLGNKYSAKDL